MNSKYVKPTKTNRSRNFFKRFNFSFTRNHDSQSLRKFQNSFMEKISLTGEIKIQKLNFIYASSRQKFLPPKSMDKYNYSSTNRKSFSHLRQQFVNKAQTSIEWQKPISLLYCQSTPIQMKAKIQANAMQRFKQLFKKQTNVRAKKIQQEQSKRLLRLLQDKSNRNSQHKFAKQKIFINNFFGVQDHKTKNHGLHSPQSGKMQKAEEASLKIFENSQRYSENISLETSAKDQSEKKKEILPNSFKTKQQNVTHKSTIDKTSQQKIIDISNNWGVPHKNRSNSFFKDKILIVQEEYINKTPLNGCDKTKPEPNKRRESKGNKLDEKKYKQGENERNETTSDLDVDEKKENNNKGKKTEDLSDNFYKKEEFSSGQYRKLEQMKQQINRKSFKEPVVKIFQEKQPFYTEEELQSKTNQKQSISHEAVHQKIIQQKATRQITQKETIYQHSNQMPASNILPYSKQKLEFDKKNSFKPSDLEFQLQNFAEKIAEKSNDKVPDKKNSQVKKQTVMQANQIKKQQKNSFIQQFRTEKQGFNNRQKSNQNTKPAIVIKTLKQSKQNNHQFKSPTSNNKKINDDYLLDLQEVNIINEQIHKSQQQKRPITATSITKNQQNIPVSKNSTNQLSSSPKASPSKLSEHSNTQTQQKEEKKNMKNIVLSKYTPPAQSASPVQTPLSKKKEQSVMQEKIQFEEDQSPADLLIELLYQLSVISAYNTESKRFYSQADSSMTEVVMIYRLASYYISQQYYFYANLFLSAFSAEKKAEFYNLTAEDFEEALQNQEVAENIRELQLNIEKAKKLINVTFDNCKTYLKKNDQNLVIGPKKNYHQKCLQYLKSEFLLLYKLYKNNFTFELGRRLCYLIEFCSILKAFYYEEAKLYEDVDDIQPSKYRQHIEENKDVFQ